MQSNLSPIRKISLYIINQSFAFEAGIYVSNMIQLAVIHSTARNFRELASGIVCVGGGDTILIRLIQHAAAHPFSGGESSVTERGLGDTHYLFNKLWQAFWVLQLPFLSLGIINI